MSSAGYNNKIIRDISTLYELALVTGRSLDLKENCDLFLKRLMGRMNVSYSAVWIKDRYLKGNKTFTCADLVYVFPEYYTATRQIPADHALFKCLEGAPVVRVTVKDPQFSKLVNEKDIEGGAFILFALGEIGVLKLYFNLIEHCFLDVELNQLLNVIEKFTISIKGCLAHQQLKSEIRERKKAEEELRKSKHILSSLIDNAPDVIVRIDTDWRVTYVNKAVERQYGIPADYLLGKRLHELEITPEQLREIRSALQRCFESAEEQVIEQNFQSLSGMTHLLIRVVPERNKTGEVESILTVTSDITGRRLAEQELKASEKRYRAVVEDQSELICRFKPDGVLTFVNRAYCRYFNKEQEELIGKTFMPLIPEEDRGIVTDQQVMIAPANPVVTYEHRVILPDGGIRWQQWVDRALFDRHGNIREYQAVGRDITDRKEAEEALQKAHAELERRVEERTAELKNVNETLRMEIFERKKAESALAEEKEFLDVTMHSIGDGVIITDTAGNITSINREAAEITGWRRSEVEGKHLAGLFCLMLDEKQFAVCENPLDLVIKEKNKQMMNQRVLVARDGTRKIVYCSGAQILDNNNTPIGNVFVIQDITENKKMEARLALAQKLESIGQLAAGIAHEINTPMQYIGDNTRFLKDSFESIVNMWYKCTQIMEQTAEANLSRALDELKEIRCTLDMDYYMNEVPPAIEQTLEGIERVSRIVSAMKNFSHPSTGKKPADLNKAIENTVTVSRNEWKYVAEINLDLAQDLPPVECEINAVNQAILNMIINAAQAIKEVIDLKQYEKGVIWIKTEALADAVQIVIGDNGAGIDPLIFNRIFDPFFTTKEVGKGTGQGLMIAHDIIVNKNGGSIQVESEVGNGTIFIVNLPIKSVPQE